MRIAIAGAGVSGAYLYRLLREEGGSEVHVYDLPKTTSCGISPCAWGATAGFIELVEHAGLEPEKYILQRMDRVTISGIEVELDIMTINKPHLIRDLLNGVEVNTSPLDPQGYERVIDATGVARAFLPPVQNDMLLACAQSRVHSERPLESRASLGYIGYGWCFPLSKNNYHIGCGSLNTCSFQALSDKCAMWHQDGKKICSCEGKVRVTSPHHSMPFLLEGKVWGVGEAIGCVGPLAGDGIVPGMRSVQLLVQHWDDGDRYTDAILREFAWMKKERRLLDKIAQGDSIGLSDAWVLKNNAKRAGMKIGLKESLAVLRRLAKL